MTNAQLMALAAEVTRALERRGAERDGAELKSQCFYPHRHQHGDAHWSCYFNPIKAAWCCRVCGAHGGVIDLAKLLGVSLPARGDVLPPRLEDFSHARSLTVETLRRFGVRPVVEFHRPALRYPTSVGIDRLKFVDGGRPKYRWAKKGGRAHWYGLRAALAALRGGAEVLYVVNGEVSVCACAQALVAALSPCGGEGTTPTPAMVEELGTAFCGLGRRIAVRIVYDADTAGRRGALEHIRPALAAAGLDVEALDIAVALADVAGGDADDLHRRVGDAGLAAALVALPPLATAKTLDVADKFLMDPTGPP
jgi:hypothetical protein